MISHDISEARLALRSAKPEGTVVSVGGVRIGGGGFTLIAGPCSVESEAQICAAAESVKRAGAVMLRGGAFKPRTSPYDFQGLGAEGVRLLLEAGERAGLPVVTEIMDASQLPLLDGVDMLQVGARGMRSYELLRALGKTGRPVLLKRDPSSDYAEFLLAAEYLLAEGNGSVVLCERGVRTFESYTRCTQDIAAVPALRELTHLPVITDPSHASGRASLVPALARAAAAAGADGVIIEVHPDPPRALCDGGQSITPEELSLLSGQLSAIRRAL